VDQQPESKRVGLYYTMKDRIKAGYKLIREGLVDVRPVHGYIQVRDEHGNISRLSRQNAVVVYHALGVALKTTR